MNKKQTISDVSRLINGSANIDQATAVVTKYLNAVSDLTDLAEWVKVNDPPTVNTMRAAADEKESDGFGGFGGGSFGGGGASGSW